MSDEKPFPTIRQETIDELREVRETQERMTTDPRALIAELQGDIIALIRSATDPRDAEIERLRTALAEQALVLEQQDRNMERVRDGLTKLRGEVAKRVDWDDDIGYWVDDIDAILGGSPCTEVTK